MKEFNVSTNIIRDADSELNYIVTKNATDNFKLIASNFKHNNRFQAIIGSYGTGKSTFLWALEQNLLGKKNFFNTVRESYPGIKSFKFLKLVGEYKPLSVSLASVLKIKFKTGEEANVEQKVLNKLKSIVKKNTQQNICHKRSRN